MTYAPETARDALEDVAARVAALEADGKRLERLRPLWADGRAPILIARLASQKYSSLCQEAAAILREIERTITD